MEVREDEKSSPEALKRLENDLKIKNPDVNEKLQQKLRNSAICQAPNASWELRFASKRFSGSHVRALEMSF